MSPEPERPREEVFWGYAELFLLVGATIPAWFAAHVITRLVFLAARGRAAATGQAIFEQFIWELLLFVLIAVMFRVQYGRSFWASLGWKPVERPLTAVAAGCGTAFAVAAVLALSRVPETRNLLVERMQDGVSIALVGFFGVTLGPMAEELLFRGFAQPVLAKSFGVAGGIALAALPFGLLHYGQYGKSWAHVIAISAAGAAFGWMRHRTGSTKASALMHGGYNALVFAAFLAAKSTGKLP